MTDDSSAERLLARMVAIASPSGEERALADWIASDVTARELSNVVVDRVGDSVLVRLRRGERPRLWLLSHLDTVPVGGGWTKEPLSGRWSGDILYGRGANDAKVCGAAMLSALFELSEAAPMSGEASSAQRGEPPAAQPRGEIAVVLTACEETNNSGMAACLDALGPPDACICGEPTGLEVCCAQGGLAILQATWRGISCHAAHAARVENVNALLVAARELAEIRSVLEVGSEHPLLGRTTVVPTQFKSGERHNVVPDLAEVVFDARLAPHTTAEDVKAALEKKLPSAEIGIRSKRLQAVETAVDHPVVRAALAAAGKAWPVASRTLSDMALLGGVPAVKCGPGRSERSHTPDEFVTRGELRAGVAFYAAAAPAILTALAARNR